MSYFILFASAFGAATFLPFYSEVTLLVFLKQDHNIGLLWAVATLGNTLGATVNWLLGRYLTVFESRPWFPFRPDSLHKSQAVFHKYGKWSLLMSWLPLGGDALTFLAGLMRVPLTWFLLLTSLGKGARYAFVIAVYMGLW